MTALMTMVRQAHSDTSTFSSSCPDRFGPSPLSIRAELAERQKKIRAHTNPIIPRLGQCSSSTASRGSNVPRTDMSTLYISATTAPQTDGSYVGVKSRSTKDHPGNPSYDVSAQTEFILQKIRGIITQASDGTASLDSVVDATVFIVDKENNFEAMDSVWRSYWPDGTKAPARTITNVSALQDPRARVEVKAIAVLDGEKDK